MNRSRSLVVAVGLAAFVSSSLAAGAATPSKALGPSPNLGKTALAERAVKAAPEERSLASIPKTVFKLDTVPNVLKTPKLVDGAGPTLKVKPDRTKGPTRVTADISGPENYGYNPFGSGTNLNTIYHYSDMLVPTNTTASYPFSTTGVFHFVNAAGASKYCSASLISRSIIITAGHCVHQGGDVAGRGRAQGWIKYGYFVPAEQNGTWPYGYAWATQLTTTSGWYNQGAIGNGYDVAMVTLGKRAGTSVEIGAYTGWLGFCTSYCLQPFWELTQLGYPSNYYSGSYMTMGMHIEANRNNTDYFHGSGMQGGSSGGPHVANLGYLYDTTTNKGLWSGRNYVFAVTSWGYISDIYKIQGASSTSGPNNSNNITGLWNVVCNSARAQHGAASCATF
jgi:V8-like Glu-specific endopeptidase